MDLQSAVKTCVQSRTACLGYLKTLARCWGVAMVSIAVGQETLPQCDHPKKPMLLQTKYNVSAMSSLLPPLAYADKPGRRDRAWARHARDSIDVNVKSKLCGLGKSWISKTSSRPP